MKLRLTPLERSIRDRVREEVKCSPPLWEEYRERRRVELVETCLVRSLFVAVGLWVAFSILAITFPQTFFASRSLMVAIPEEVALLATSLLATTCFLLEGGRFWSDARTAGMLGLFPVADEQFARRRLWGDFGRSLLTIAIILMTYRYLSWLHHFSAVDWLVVGFFASLTIVVNISILCGAEEVAQSQKGHSTLCIVAFSCLVAICPMTLGMLNTHLVPLYKQICPFALAILPGGWINGAIYYGYIQKNPLGWLYLLPVGLALGYLVHAVRRPFAIREIHFEANKVSAIDLADGRVIASSRVRRELLASAAESKEFPPTESPEPETLVSAVLRNQNEPKSSDWLDNRVARWLLPRERAVLRSWSGLKSLYTRQFYVHVVGLIIAIAVAYWMPPEASLRAVSLVTFGAICLGSARDHLADYESVCRYPIRFAEPLAIKLKARLLLAPLFLAMVLPTAQVVAAIHGRSTSDAIVAGVLPVFWSLSLLPIGMLFQLLLNEDVRAELPLQVAKNITGLFIFFSGQGLLVGSLFSPHSIVRLLCLVGMPLLSWIAWLLCSWAFHELPVDIVRTQKTS